MELYGSLLNISGSVSASAFTGSFIGDGSGLTGIQADAVVGLNLSQIATGSFTASLSPNGFNVNTDTSITGSVNITGSISLNGEPIGTGKLNETTFQEYTSSNDGRVTALETSSGSLNSFTSSINTTIKSKLDSDNVISGSIQVDITGTTGYSTFSSSIATTDLNQTNRLISIENKTGSYATTGSNLFIGTQTHSGSILPSVDNEYDLGSPSFQWRDVYISSGSLYIDGTKVLSSTAQELIITTDSGQSIKILEGGTDSIILQSADGNIELKSNADGDILLDPTNGKILLKGTVEVLNGNKIQSSVGGTPVVFAGDVVVSGSIELTGTIDGIDLTAFSSSVNTRVGNLESSGGNLNAFTASATTRLNSLETTTGSLNSYTSSNTTNINDIHTSTGSLNSYTSSNDSNISAIHTSTSSLNTFTSSANDRLTSLETASSSLNSYTGSNNGRVSAIETSTSSLNLFTSSFNAAIELTGSNLTVRGDFLVKGTTTNVNTATLDVDNNLINLNGTGAGFAGLRIKDVTQPNLISGSFLWDSLNDKWIAGQLGSEDDVVLLSATQSLANKTISGASNTLTNIGNGSLTNSSISIAGNTISLGGTISTATILTSTGVISGSAQVVASLPSGTVSGSSQVLNGTTIHSGSFFNGISVVSGSGQISFNGITDKPALVSGSSQISYTGLVNIPNGIVSGSSQISFNGITDKPTLVSGSVQIDLTATTNYSSGIKTRLNAEGVISGSSQVVLTSGQVTTGLGFTPYNATNPSGYISSYTETDTLASVTARGATTSTALSLSGRVTFGSAIANRPQFPGGILGIDTGDGNFDIWGISREYYPSHPTAGDAWGLRWNGNNNDFEFVGGGTNRVILDMDSGNITATGTLSASGYNSTNWNTAFGWGNHASAGYASASLSNNKTYTSTGNAAGSFLGGHYSSGGTEKPNSATFGAGKFKVAMLSGGNLGFGGSWNDVMWVSTYNGGDVKSSHALVFDKYSTNVWVSDQDFDSASWGTGHLLLHTSNFNSYSPTLTGGGASGTWGISITGNAATASSTGTLSSNAVTSGYLVIGGNYSNNAFNTVGSTRLMFGGGNSDAIDNYYIGTNLENVGGNYTKLDLRWHTGIRMGAQASYGGIRFYNNEDLSSVLFSIGSGDGNVRSHTHLLPSANSTYDLGSSSLRWNTVFTSDLSLSNGIGDYTIVEGEEKLYLYNNKNNKVYSFVLQEEDPTTATPKKS